MVEFVAKTLDGNRKKLYRKLRRALPFSTDGEPTINSESLRYR